MKSFTCSLVLYFYNEGECIYTFDHEVWSNQFPLKNAFEGIADCLQLISVSDELGYHYDLTVKQVRYCYDFLQRFYRDYYNSSKARALLSLLKDYNTDAYFARISTDSRMEWELNHEFALKVLEFDNIKIRYFYEEYPS
jgi:hypothetical protein